MNTVGLLNEALYYYIERKNSATTTGFSDRFFDIEIVLALIRDKLWSDQVLRKDILQAELIELVRLYRIIVSKDVRLNFTKDKSRIKKLILERKRHAKNSSQLIELYLLMHFDKIYDKIIINKLRTGGGE